jgi:hypothetical protein
MPSALETGDFLDSQKKARRRCFMIYPQRKVIATMAALLFSAGVAIAQFDVGNIRGNVYDPTGAVVPGATVTMTNLGTGQRTEVKTDAAGNFSASSLPFGNYIVSATAEGFGVATSSTIRLNVSTTADVTIKLPLAKTRQQVEVTVTGEAATVQTTSNVEGNVVTPRQVEDLPLNGRDVTSLFALVPGSVQSTPLPSFNGLNFFYGPGVLLDGATAERPGEFFEVATFGRQNSRINRASVDSVGEVDIMNTGYDAQYGRVMGTVVNIITKSGTNQLHGGVFEYLRNEDLNARNFFEYTPTRQPFKLNQFGGNLGGPIIKNKLFFFVNYEGVRQHITDSYATYLLSASERAKFVPSMAPVVDAMASLPANATVVPGTNGTVDYYNANLVNGDREDTGSLKIDYVMSTRDRWNFRYNLNDSTTNSDFGVNKGQVVPVPGRSQFFRLDETHTFGSNLINEFGVALDRMATYDAGGGDPHGYSFSVAGNVASLPGAGLFDILQVGNSIQLLDSLTYVHGRHTLKFGTDLMWVQNDEAFLRQDTLIFASMAGFEQNMPVEESRLEEPMIGLRNHNLDFYAQDNWKMTPRLNLNLGLRYEFNPPGSESHGRIANFNLATQQLQPGFTYYPEYRDFQPRLGFAYDPFGKGKTVIRASGGIFTQAALPYYISGLVGNVVGLSYTVTTAQYPDLVFPVPEVLPWLAPSTTNVAATDPHMRDPYTMSWTFDVQQQILPRTILDVAYLGNRSVKLPPPAAINYNVVNPYTGLTPNPEWGSEGFTGNELSSKYSALQVAVRHRSGKFTFDVNYTWSHQIDNFVSPFGAEAALEDPYDIRADWGNGDTDVRNLFTADVLYDLPNLRSSVNIANQVLGNWRVGTMLQARSGLPLNIENSTPGFFSTTPIRPDYVLGQSFRPPNYSLPFNQLNPAAFAPTSSATGTLARNATFGPDFAQWDLSLMKDIKLTERYRLQFRADGFNVLNHPNFSNPDGGLCSVYAFGTCTPNPDFGHSDSTIGNLVGIGTSRQIQFALKLLF